MELFSLDILKEFLVRNGYASIRLRNDLIREEYSKLKDTGVKTEEIEELLSVRYELGADTIHGIYYRKCQKS